MGVTGGYVWLHVVKSGYVWVLVITSGYSVMWLRVVTGVKGDGGLQMVTGGYEWLQR